MEQGLLQTETRRFVINQEHGLRQLLGTFPCTYPLGTPHPVASVEGRRLARFRRHFEGGVRYKVRGGSAIYFLTLAMRYEKGVLKGDLRYSTQRFIQTLRRKGLSLEYLRVIESTQAGVRNHAHLILSVKGGELPPEHELKDIWAHSTYGSSFEVKLYPANQDIGWLSRYLSKALGSYLSKSFPEASSGERGLDSSCQNATNVSTSRGWLPKGAEHEWKRLFRENAFIWSCSRGFYHTDLGETSPKWLNWIDRQAWGRG